MKLYFNARTTLLSLAFITASGIGISSFVGQANASILDECHASSRNKVVACCKHYIERNGRPMWMFNGEENNCAAAVVCVGKSSASTFFSVAYVKPSCFLKSPNDYNGGGDKAGIPNTPPRGANSPIG